MGGDLIESIEFHITNNAWINNGLVRLIIELEDKFANELLINRENNSVIINSKSNKSIEDYLNDVLNYLAAFGTFNFSQELKKINKYLNYSFQPKNPYPLNPKETKETENITKDIRDEMKKVDKNLKISSKIQIWKRRVSYIDKKSDNYFKFGLNFKDSDEFTKLIENAEKKNICPVCGSLSEKMIDIKQSINPLSNEHHNNKVEGFGGLRLNNKFCPKCNFLSLISFFDKYIPFYQDDKNNVFLALPNIYDLSILEKIASNLSLNGQYIDLSNENVTNYNKNIINFVNISSNSASMLSLLNNIQNKFSKDQSDDLFQILSSDELMEIVDWIFIKKDSFSINRIKANNNVYKILKPQIDENGDEFYLVNDIFNKNTFKNFSPFKIEKFFKAFLDFNDEDISKYLFEMVKSDVKFFNIYRFKELFLDKILGEILMLNEEFKKACKSISETIGKSFYKDIGLLSKFAYATDDKMFKEYLEEAFFLMAKKSALGSETSYSNRNELEIFFDGLDETNFRETKSYFVSFMSSSALYTNYKTNEKSKKEDN